MGQSYLVAATPFRIVGMRTFCLTATRCWKLEAFIRDSSELSLIGLLSTWDEVLCREYAHKRLWCTRGWHYLCNLRWNPNSQCDFKLVRGKPTFKFYKSWICKFIIMHPLRWSVSYSWDYKLSLMSKSQALQRCALLNNIALQLKFSVNNTVYSCKAVQKCLSRLALEEGTTPVSLKLQWLDDIWQKSCFGKLEKTLQNVSL